MMSLFARRTTKTVSVRFFERLIGFSVPPAIPGIFINPKAHIVSFLRYSISARMPARPADIRTWGVTLFHAFSVNPNKPKADNSYNKHQHPYSVTDIRQPLCEFLDWIDQVRVCYHYELRFLLIATTIPITSIQPHSKK